LQTSFDGEDAIKRPAIKPAFLFAALSVYGFVSDEEPPLLGAAPLLLPMSEDDGGELGSAGLDGLGVVLEPLIPPLESGAVLGVRDPGVPVAPVPPLYAPGSVRGSWVLSPQAARPPRARTAAAAIKVFFISISLSV
jgi:hypothetical protein